MCCPYAKNTPYTATCNESTDSQLDDSLTARKVTADVALCQVQANSTVTLLVLLHY